MCRECSCFSRSCRSVSPMRPRPCWSKCDANRVDGFLHANSDTCKKIDVEKSVRGQFADTADSQPEEGGGQERSPRRSAHAFDALALAILTPTHLPDGEGSSHLRPFPVLVHPCVVDAHSNFQQHVETDTIVRLKRGDLSAFESVYRQFERAAWTLALRLTGRADVAQEVLQDAMLKA